MEYVANFLESSTIHGLAYIATSRKYVRLFWIVVVIAGFTVAGILIQTSFQSWNDSPVKTTIETHSISKITFPKVTVCPPKNTYTDFNYDLMMTKNMTLNNVTRRELTNYAMELLYDHLYETNMANMSKLKDDDRYYNWYHGYTAIKLPYGSNQVNYFVYTTATSGSISTQYFGQEFDADKVEPFFFYRVRVDPPNNVWENPNVTLHFEIQKLPLKHLSSGHDKLLIDESEMNGNKSYTPPDGGMFGQYHIDLDRNVLLADVRIQKLSLMPGFRLSWHYSGMKVEPEARFYNNNPEFTDSMAFVRSFSMLHDTFISISISDFHL